LFGYRMNIRATGRANLEVKMLALLRNPIAMMIACLISASAAFAAGDGDGVHEIGDGVYSFTMGEGNHSMFVVGDNSVAVFEIFHSGHAAKLLEGVRGVTDKPVKYAFISHNHWDHASGGQVFSDAGAQTVMHERAAEWVRANPGRDTAPPDMTWSGDRKDIIMGDFTVQMHYLGMNHGLGLTIFVIPERGAAYIADLVTPNRVMFAVVPDFNIGEWERSLGEILEMDFKLAVCSHNALPPQEAMNGCTRTHVEEERQFIRDLRNGILAEFQKGTDFMEIPKAVRLPKYAHWVGYEEWLEMNTLRLMTDLWMGPFPWVPNAK
jgi:glyoxylase-like metal-dependent hydrolase (beta-lactamase superfamily II)